MEHLEPADAQRPHLWWASDLTMYMGYKDPHSIFHLVEEAVQIMVSIGISYYENVIPEDRVEKGKRSSDFHLSRFACYLVAMLADRKKKKVAQVQERVIRKTESYGLSIQDFFELQRLRIREELSDANKWLTSIAAKGNVTNYSSFNNAGYKGLYSMHSAQLHDSRQLAKDHNQQEFMGRVELAANLFRITLAEQEIKSKQLIGQSNLELAHYNVGQGIRFLLKSRIGIFPEELPVYSELAELKLRMKQGYKRMKEADAAD